MTTWCFIEPLDVLYLRGNKLFGDPGSFGESVIPPWPSVAAGALRSALLAHKRHDLTSFVEGLIDDPELGTPVRPGSFTITAFHLARRYKEGRTEPEPLFPLPADLVVSHGTDGKPDVKRLTPHSVADGIRCSAATARLAVLPEKTERGKPVSDRWLTAEGWQAHLDGNTVDERHLLSAKDLWQIDTRVGVGLDPGRRAAAEGKLFTVQAVALGKIEHGSACDVGFIVGIAGAHVPEELTLRFGGDGRAALSRLVELTPPQVDYQNIVRHRRCRLILATPGLFAGGWRPTGVDEQNRFDLHGVRGRLVCAAVPRAEVVSGWDLAAWSQRQRTGGGPKPARRAAPTGSVYWLDELDATADTLRGLAEKGLWHEDMGSDREPRRAEGFNNVFVAAWPR